ncbi:MAG: hypothetical protein V3R93_06800, partial [Candidatus Hydrothermarchaeaceae archaeon]
IGRLEINAPVREVAAVKKTGDIPPGTYPGVLFVEYRDANSYPFSAIVPFDIFQRQVTGSPITGVMEEVKLSGKQHKKLRLRMKNSADEAYKVTVELFVPRELDVKEPKAELQIPPLGEKYVEFEVSSFSALPGSTYPVFCTITHESNGKVYSTFTRGVVKIGEERPVFSENVMPIVLAVLLVIFVFYQIKDRKWKR